MGRGRFVGATAGGLLLIAAAGLPAVNSLGAAPQPPFSRPSGRRSARWRSPHCRQLPADPTNRFADDPAAAALGATLFFDQRLSANGKVACATCHKIDRQFQDDLPLGEGLGTANRRTMPLAGAAWSVGSFGTAARTACGRRRSRRWKSRRAGRQPHRLRSFHGQKFRSPL